MFDLESLPPEILLKILSYLPHKMLVSKVSVQNRYLYDLSHDSSLWKDVEIDKTWPPHLIAKKLEIGDIKSLTIDSANRNPDLDSSESPPELPPAGLGNIKMSELYKVLLKHSIQRIRKPRSLKPFKIVCPMFAYYVEVISDFGLAEYKALEKLYVTCYTQKRG